MITIFAEKPDVGRKIAAALGPIVLKDGTKVAFKDISKYEKAIKAIQAENGYIPITFKGKECRVTHGVGHLCALWELKDYDADFKNWHNIDLPYIPSYYNIKPIESSKKQLMIVKKLFNESELIINATDWDREGEVIFSYVYEYAKCKKPYKRVYYNSQTEEAFVNAFNDLREAAEVKNLEQAGRCRGIADWLIGMNVTVAATLAGNTKGVLSVGRVQTPTLAMVVEREKAIQNFKKEKYYVPAAVFTTKSGETYKGEYKDKIKDKSEAEAIISKLSGKAVIKNVDAKEEKTSAPSLYSLSLLQMDANSKLGLTADETLAIVQELYEMGVVTYPRTSSAFLPEDYRPQTDRALKALEGLEAYAPFLRDRPRNYDKRYFNDKKVESHFAIVPTHVTTDKLSGDKAKVYDLICKSLIMTIYPPAITLKTKVVTVDNGVEFASHGSAIKSKGWMEVAGTSKDSLLPNLTAGENVTGEYEASERTTEPPKRYTDKTLVAAMMSADKDADEKDIKSLAELNIVGIGQESTRAAIIKNLVDRGYIERQKKNFHATVKGISLIDNLPVDEVKSATLTAQWETRLNDVANGKESPSVFIKDIEGLTRKWCEDVKKNMSAVRTAPATNEGDPGGDVICPVCGRPMKKSPKGYGCTGYKEGACSFFIGFEICEKKLTEKQIQTLLTKGITGEIKGFKSKSGKTFSAKLKIEDGKVKFAFD